LNDPAVGEPSSPVAAEDRRLRDACRLAVGVAQDGELARPRVPAPPALLPVLGFRRLSSTSYRLIARVLADDEAFRARVAAEADEDAVGRIGWLWLHRPEGWVDEVAALDRAREADAPPPRGRSRDDEAARHRRAREEAERERKKATGEAAGLRREAAQARAEADRLATELRAARDEQQGARRSAKDLEAKLATARHELKTARLALREAEHELASLRAAGAPPGEASAAAAAAAAVTAAGGGLDADGAAALRERLVALERQADELRALAADAMAQLGPGPAPEPTPTPAEAPAARGKGAAGTGRRRGRGASARRALVPLPPGIFDGTPEANRHLLTSPIPVVIVDGYNVARRHWSGLEPSEERRRAVALFEEAQARSGATIVVVFDGDRSVVGPVASRRVRVVFSDTGETADDRISALVAATPLAQPVVVVSSDRAVADDARAQGASALGVEEAFAALGR
jgi:hypothetical protein